ncbi:MAG: metallophosphoesterase, partial [Bacteroidales bacterium]|nr:metallophosphoesterase [Bacteroidales bacterium]
MKRHFPLLLVAVLATAACGPKELTFFHLADTQIGMCDTTAHYRLTDSLMADAVKAINAVKPACVVITGDLVNNWNNEEQRAIYKGHIAEIDPSVAVYAVPGNHDHPNFSDEVVSYYNDLVGYDRFSFTKGNCAFIGFDSCVILNGTPEAEEAQLEWLKAELGKARKKDHIFLFCHCPLAQKSLDEPEQWDNFPFDKREKYSSLFKEYGVEALFTGHTHALNVADFDGMKSYNASAVSFAFEGSETGFNVAKV